MIITRDTTKKAMGVSVAEGRVIAKEIVWELDGSIQTLRLSVTDGEKFIFHVKLDRDDVDEIIDFFNESLPEPCPF